jgi:hypothetical protein
MKKEPAGPVLFDHSVVYRITVVEFAGVASLSILMNCQSSDELLKSLSDVKP